MKATEHETRRCLKDAHVDADVYHQRSSLTPGCNIGLKHKAAPDVDLFVGEVDQKRGPISEAGQTGMSMASSSVSDKRGKHGVRKRGSVGLGSTARGSVEELCQNN